MFDKEQIIRLSSFQCTGTGVSRIVLESGSVIQPDFLAQHLDEHLDEAYRKNVYKFKMMQIQRIY